MVGQLRNSMMRDSWLSDGISGLRSRVGVGAEILRRGILPEENLAEKRGVAFWTTNIEMQCVRENAVF